VTRVYWEIKRNFFSFRGLGLRKGARGDRHCISGKNRTKNKKEFGGEGYGKGVLRPEKHFNQKKRIDQGGINRGGEIGGGGKDTKASMGARSWPTNWE